MGNSNSSTVLVPQISVATTTKGLPTSIKISYQKQTTKITCLLNEPNSRPLFAATLPSGFWGSVIIHDGTSDEDPALATIRDEGSRGDTFAIALPPSPSDEPPVGHELVKWEAISKKERYWFGMQVGQGATRQLERFEWRRSHGSEVKSLGASKWGWKLVRVTLDQSGSGQDALNTDGKASDGNEIVAVWTDAGGFTSSGVGELHFRGSGATGEFGHAWAIMVLSSCFVIWLTRCRAAT